jgi:hypothetical protein
MTASGQQPVQERRCAVLARQRSFNRANSPAAIAVVLNDVRDFVADRRKSHLDPYA